jgi:hypothetical protein
VFGGFETDKRFCSGVCNEVGCVVVDVDYRLAPEFPWPAQLQDSWAALLWVYSFFYPSFLNYNPSSDLICTVDLCCGCFSRVLILGP